MFTTELKAAIEEHVGQVSLMTASAASRSFAEGEAATWQAAILSVLQVQKKNVILQQVTVHQ